MMAIPMLLILQVLVILCSPLTHSYPVYGTKRYGRSSVPRSWAPYQMVHTQRYPINYYELYPYSQTYPEDLYPQETYPVYYPRTSKYEVYQAVLPYYYEDRPFARYGGYYDNDPVTDIQEEMLQEAEREEREEAQPIGHEMLYENEDQNNNNMEDVNAAFLQNLIMSQMYKDNQKDNYDDYYPSYDTYGKWEDTPSKTGRYSQEDQDVKELKQLTKQSKGREHNSDDIHWFQRNNFRNQKEQQRRNNYDEKRDSTFSNRKPSIKLASSTPPPSSSIAPKRDARGQKEEVLMRPATPVRHPFTSPVLEMMSKNDEKKRTPSVYDTIKHMLDMEKSLENKYKSEEIRPQMKKRIVSNEENLTHQLSLLKKAQ